MLKVKPHKLLPPFLGAVLALFSIGVNPALTASPQEQTGVMQLKVDGLNPRGAIVPEFTLSLKTTNGLEEQTAITAGINSEAGAIDRVVLNKAIPSLVSYSTELPIISRTLPSGEYYLYVQIDGFETSRNFSISNGSTTHVSLLLSHVELRVPQCGYYNSNSVEFHLFIPQGPPIYRNQIPCDSRRIFPLEPGDYEGVVTDEDQKSRVFPFTVQEGTITPVELRFP